jgi:hypothetical protein
MEPIRPTVRLARQYAVLAADDGQHLAQQLHLGEPIDIDSACFGGDAE